MSSLQKAGEKSFHGRRRKENEDTTANNNNKLKNNILHDMLEDYEFDEAYNIILQNPSLCKSYGRLGEYPLHMALKRGAPENLLLLLLEKWPQVCSRHSVTSSNNANANAKDKSLPLHLATLHACPARVILNLITIYPQALDKRDEDGDTPRDCLRRDLDSFAKDSLRKPTFYWIDLMERIKNDYNNNNNNKSEISHNDNDDNDMMNYQNEISLLKEKLKTQKEEFDEKESEYQVEIQRLKKHVNYLTKKEKDVSEKLAKREKDIYQLEQEAKAQQAQAYDVNNDNCSS